MADENEYVSPHDDISAAYNALNAIQDIDCDMYGKRLKPRIERTCLFIIDKSLQEIAKQWEDVKEEED